MRNTRRDAVVAAFMADCLALGPHWIYDQERITREFPDFAAPTAPLPDSYHKTKGLGDFTHYGDQMLVLLESLAGRGAFDRADFAARWKALFETYDGYVDAASRRTLENLKAGWPFEDAGSTSEDLAGAARFAPLLAYLTDEDALAEAARQQAALTHTAPLVLDAAEFFARAAARILAGEEPVPAMRGAAQALDGESVAELVEKGLASVGGETLSVIAAFGQNCHSPSALPAVAHLVAAYADDPARGLLQNVLAGGDSAARGIAVGALLGAARGLDAFPAAWRTAMNAHGRIEALLP